MHCQHFLLLQLHVNCFTVELQDSFYCEAARGNARHRDQCHFVSNVVHLKKKTLVTLVSPRGPSVCTEVTEDVLCQRKYAWKGNRNIQVGLVQQLQHNYIKEEKLNDQTHTIVISTQSVLKDFVQSGDSQ